MATPPSGAFERVWVDYAVLGTARVGWDLSEHLVDPDPASWTYKLQASAHGPLPTTGPDGVTVRTDDWADVGPAQVNVPLLTDTTRRAFGKTLLVSYRVVLTTPVATYVSDPAVSLGHLSKHDWIVAREITRKELLLHSKKTSVPGSLFRRMRQGRPCPRCRDPYTGEPTLSHCSVCKGTGFTQGYFAAVPGFFCRLEPRQTREHRDLARTGTSKDDTTRGRMPAVPGMVSGDVWADSQSDLRYAVHVVGVAAQVRNVPLVLDVELRQLAFDDVAYTLQAARPGLYDSWDLSRGQGSWNLGVL